MQNTVHVFEIRISNYLYFNYYDSGLFTSIAVGIKIALPW